MKINPLKAIRKYCVKFCMNNQPREVELCPSTDCNLYFFRFGRKKVKGSVLKAIRAKCLDCSGFSPKGVRECEFSECALFLYHSGNNPHRRGITGGSRNFQGKNLSVRGRILQKKGILKKGQDGDNMANISHLRQP